MINSRIGLCAAALAAYFLIDQTVHVWIEDPTCRPLVVFLLALGAFLLAALFLIVMTIQARADARVDLQVELTRQAEEAHADAILSSVRETEGRVLSPRFRPRAE